MSTDRLHEIERTWRQANATRPTASDSWLNGYQSDVSWLLARVRDLEAALREYLRARESVKDALKNPPPSSADHYTRVQELEEADAALAALLAGETAASDAVNYTGTDASVECAYPPCRNRLRYADFGAQFCSKEHRRLAGETAGEAEQGSPTGSVSEQHSSKGDVDDG